MAALLLWGCEQTPDQSTEPVLRLLVRSVDVGAEGGTVTVNVVTNVEYYCEVMEDWVREVETKSAEAKPAETYAHTFVVDPNPSEEERSAVISFCGNQNCIPFTITQEGVEVEYALNVDKENISVEYTGTETPITVNVTSNVEWQVVSDADWCTVSTAAGSGDGSFTVSVVESAETEPRVCNVTVSSDEIDVVRNVIVTQAAKPEDVEPDWINSEFFHRSLIMRFTATWCGYCPMMAESVEKTLEKRPGKFEALSVHGSDSELATSASLALEGHYPIAGYPTGIVDGYYEVGNGLPTSTMMNFIMGMTKTETDYDVYTGYGFKSMVLDSKIVLNLDVYVKKAGDYKVTALLVEDGIVHRQANGSSYAYDYVHNGVVQSAFTNALGDSFTTDEDNVKKNFAYSLAVPKGSKVENLKVVVYVQRKEGKVTFVDNVASAKVGETLKVAVVG